MPSRDPDPVKTWGRVGLILFAAFSAAFSILYFWR